MSGLILFLHAIGRFFYLRNIKLISVIIRLIQQVIFNSYIPHGISIGSGCKFAYGGIGVVIHDRVIIGKNCVLGQGITIGGRSKKYQVPIIGDNVYIGAGARILGDVTIGNNSVIGANAVVIEDVPDNCIVVGVPAKIIRQGINPKDYY